MNNHLGVSLITRMKYLLLLAYKEMKYYVAHYWHCRIKIQNSAMLSHADMPLHTDACALRDLFANAQGGPSPAPPHPCTSSGHIPRATIQATRIMPARATRWHIAPLHTAPPYPAQYSRIPIASEQCDADGGSEWNDGRCDCGSWGVEMAGG